MTKRFYVVWTDVNGKKLSQGFDCSLSAQDLVIELQGKGINPRVRRLNDDEIYQEASETE